MVDERKIFLLFFSAIVLVVALAVLAMRVPPPSTVAVPTDLMSLPVSISNASQMEPDAAGCEAAGGTVKWERTVDCVTEPDVHDVCGFGVPCVTGGKGARCFDARISYCACAGDAHCPENYRCQTDDRCVPGALEKNKQPL